MSGSDLNRPPLVSRNLTGRLQTARFRLGVLVTLVSRVFTIGGCEALTSFKAREHNGVQPRQPSVPCLSSDHPLQRFLILVAEACLSIQPTGIPEKKTNPALRTAFHLTGFLPHKKLGFRRQCAEALATGCTPCWQCHMSL